MSKNKAKAPQPLVIDGIENKNLTPEERKKKRIRTIALILAVAAFLSLSAFALSRIVRKVPGYYAVDAEADADCPLYAGGVSFTYYFSGSSEEIRSAQMELKTLYSSALKRIYKLLDPENEYEGFKNIAYINAHRGEDIELDPDLYAILADAVKHTEAGEFNLFGGALYTEWQQIRVLNDRESFDPAVNEPEAERLAGIAAACTNEANFSLRLVDPIKHIVNFTVSAEYERFESDYEVKPSALDLGWLRYAYMLDHLRDQLVRAGYDRGYLIAPDGLTLTLAGLEDDGQYVISTLIGEEPKECVGLPMAAGSACAVYRAFDYEDAKEYYRISSEDRVLYRHPHFSEGTGEVYDALFSAAALDKNGSLVSACIAANRLFSFEDLSAAAAAAKELASDDMLIAYIPQEQPSVLFIDAADAASVTALNGFEIAVKTF